MKKETTGTQKVVVTDPAYLYRGHLYEKGEVFVMDNCSVTGAVARGQLKVKQTKPAETKKKGPGSNRATGPSENR